MRIHLVVAPRDDHRFGVDIEAGPQVAFRSKGEAQCVAEEETRRHYGAGRWYVQTLRVR